VLGCVVYACVDSVLGLVQVSRVVGWEGVCVLEEARGMRIIVDMVLVIVYRFFRTGQKLDA
jgi:hypothetical protein